VHGFATDHWTHQRVVTLIRRMFGVSFCAFHAGRLLAASGWEASKPLHRTHQSKVTESQSS
jgi:hypothetical protein